MNKKDIDNMSYESMMRLWRFAPVGDMTFQGEMGDYFAKVMNEKKEKLKSEDQVKISKKIGW